MIAYRLSDGHMVRTHCEYKHMVEERPVASMFMLDTPPGNIQTVRVEYDRHEVRLYQSGPSYYIYLPIGQKPTDVHLAHLEKAMVRDGHVDASRLQLLRAIRSTLYAMCQVRSAHKGQFGHALLAVDRPDVKPRKHLVRTFRLMAIAMLRNATRHVAGQEHRDDLRRIHMPIYRVYSFLAAAIETVEAIDQEMWAKASECFDVE